MIQTGSPQYSCQINLSKVELLSSSLEQLAYRNFLKDFLLALICISELFYIYFKKFFLFFNAQIPRIKVVHCCFKFLLRGCIRSRCWWSCGFSDLNWFWWIYFLWRFDNRRWWLIFYTILWVIFVDNGWRCWANWFVDWSWHCWFLILDGNYC